MPARRPLLALPEDVGRGELAAFVALPALLPLIFGGQWRSAAVTAAANLALLALIYGVVGYGLLSIVRWVFARLLSQLASSLALLMRAIPLLMIFSVVLFLTVEMWEVFSDLPLASFAVLAGLFVALGTSFLIARVPREVRSLEREAGGEGPELDRRQRAQRGAGPVRRARHFRCSWSASPWAPSSSPSASWSIDADLLRSWIGSGGNVLLRIDLFGHRGILTEELLRVSGRSPPSRASTSRSRCSPTRSIAASSSTS